jgi:hypothetical protein
VNGPAGLDTRRVATYLARARFGLGLAFCAAPSLVGRGWVGSHAESRGARTFARIAGVRDAALGAGAAISIAQGRGGGDWVSMLAVCDAGDALFSLLTPGLPARARVVGICAAASGAAHLLLARELAATEAE